MKITRTEKEIKVTSDYHKDLPRAARQLGGKWNNKEWIFDIRSEKAIEELYIDVYGFFGEPTQTVTITYTLTEDIIAGKQSIFICGRQVARAYGRDSGAQVGGGVVLKDCTAESGGSVKNWSTRIVITGDSPTITIYDVPLKKAEQCTSEDENIKIKGDVEINKETLKTEKAELLKRIKEIDALLN